MYEPNARIDQFLHLTQRIRVPLGFLMGPLLVVAARPSIRSVTAGSFVALAGLALRAWASGCLRKNEQLTTSGPYAYTRNPLYLGTLLMGIGVSVSAAALWFAALFLVLYVAIYLPVMIAEARTLSRLFPEEYDRYSRNVPLFFPAPLMSSGVGGPGARSSPAPGFELNLYVKHREYRAALGLLAVLLLLVLEAYVRI
jgi:protein-S-isoprenylcysteine O-methyltransferase Ste14